MQVEVRRGTVFKLRKSGAHYTQVETASGLRGLMQNDLLRPATVREAEVWDTAAVERLAAAAERERSESEPRPPASDDSVAGSITEIPADDVPLGLGLLAPSE